MTFKGFDSTEYIVPELSYDFLNASAHFYA